MTTYKDELTIDFGTVGYWNSQELFRVRLDSGNLLNLIKDASNAYRVYELLLIDRPGDVWDYVSVVVEAGPKRVTESINHAREKSKHRWATDYPWSETCIPFPVFDKLFSWMGDDTEPPDEAWRGHRDSPAMIAYAQQLLAMVRKAQSGLDWNDHLLRHIVGKAKSGSHPFACLSRADAIVSSAGTKPNEPSHTSGFYKKLNDLLRDPELVSVAYRAEGDYKVLRILATEQRRRANLTKHELDDAFQVSVIVNHRADNAAWDSRIWFYEEGLGPGDLFIEGGGLGSASIKELIEVHRHRLPGRYILSINDEGDIQGFEKDGGDGWVLYKKIAPFDRRRCLEHRESRRSTEMGPVLKFAARGATLFDYDKALIVVGTDVSVAAKAALATAIAEWEAHGGDPVVIVFGDLSPFDVAGCRRIFTPPDEIETAGAASSWFASLVRVERPWIDVIIAFEAPNWISQELSWRAKRTEGPWQPWVVRSTGSSELDAALVVEGDLAVAILEAHRLARASRSQRL